MPKIDMAKVPARKGSGYPPPFDAPCAERTRRRLGDAGGLRDFGVNLMTLPAGGWSSQRLEPRRKRLCEHMINRSSVTAVYLEVGSRNPHDLTTCSDIDMMSTNADGRFVHKDGTPYPTS